ncbi:MAG: DUF1302 domain-containing protein [Rhodospirillaceae bacterium]|nr:DUF1302 domain-containing protein [Rhodospirillaceae bacterium]
MPANVIPLMRRSAVGIVLSVVACGPPAFATEIYNNGSAAIRWDNTLRYSGGLRLESANPVLLADPNADDGDRDFKSGLISNRFDLTSELGVRAGNFGAEISGTAWYDTVFAQSTDNTSPATFNPRSVSNTSFVPAVRDLHGRNAELLNAFVYGAFDLGDLPVALRAGRHTVVWGESLFFAENGVAAGQAPVDATRAASLPYARAGDVYLPVWQVSGSVQPASNISVGFYYQFEWRRSRFPGVGSFFSASDFADTGGERIIVSPTQYLQRARDYTPPSPQFGAAVHVNTDAVDLGFYASRFDARYPALYIRSGAYTGGTAIASPAATAASPVEKTASYGVPSGGGAGGAYKINVPPGAYSGTGQVGAYYLVYPDAIQVYGISASGYLGDSSLAGEISTRRNMPLVSRPRIVPSGTPIDGGPNALFAIGDTLHAQVSAITNFAPSKFWDGANLSAEVAANRVLEVTRNPAARDLTRNTFAMALRGVFEPQYFNVFPGADISVPVGFGYGLMGNSAIDGGQNAKAGDMEFGLRMLYRSVWEASLTLTRYLGPPARQPFADRDYLSFSIRRTF